MRAASAALLITGAGATFAPGAAQSMLEEASHLMLQSCEKGTGAVADFTKATMDAISSGVEPAIMDAHASDAKLLAELFSSFAAIDKQMNNKKEKIETMAKERTQQKATHLKCRQHQQTLAEKRQAAQKELAARWEKVEDHEASMNTISTGIHTKWCKPGGNESSPIFRDHAVKQFTSYEKKKLETDKVWEIYNEQVPITKKCEADEAAADKKCDTVQVQLETFACEESSERKETNKAIKTSWDEAVANYKKAVAQIKELEKDRHHEYSTLQQVKCILGSIDGEVKTGKVCKSGDAGAAKSELDKCHNVAVDLAKITLTYKNIPEQPKVVPDIPVPPTSQWTATHLANMPKDAGAEKSIKCAA